MKAIRVALSLALLAGMAAAQTVIAGLPPGIKLNASGQLQGIPVASGSYQFTAQVQDQAQQVVSRQFFVTINAKTAGLQITTPAQLPAGTQNQPYSQTLQATGGTGTLTWSVVTTPAPTTPKATAPAVKKPTAMEPGAGATLLNTAAAIAISDP